MVNMDYSTSRPAPTRGIHIQEKNGRIKIFGGKNKNLKQLFVYGGTIGETLEADSTNFVRDLFVTTITISMPDLNVAVGGAKIALNGSAEITDCHTIAPIFQYRESWGKYAIWRKLKLGHPYRGFVIAPIKNPDAHFDIYGVRTAMDAVVEHRNTQYWVSYFYPNSPEAARLVLAGQSQIQNVPLVYKQS